VIADRERVKEKLRRLGLAFVDGVYDEREYRRQRQALTSQLESLVIPEVDLAREAGNLIQSLPDLWSQASLRERHRLLSVIIDAVYIDLKTPTNAPALKLKPPFEDLLNQSFSLDRSVA
jgi:hypothetical protein